MTTPDRRFAKDVAKQLDRRRTRRKVAVYTGLAGAIALAASYLTCGRNFGLGGKGSGAGPGTGSALVVAADAGPPRCALRVTATGITVDGTAASRDEAVAACKSRGRGADVIVTGDARQGDWDELKVALDRAGIEIFRREPK